MIAQRNIRKSILDEDNQYRGEYHILIENQKLEDCYQENCAAWDVEKKKCKKYI